MKLNKMKKEELELLTYTDLANLILKEEQKSMNTPSIFKKICDLLGLSEEEYIEKVSDFYTSLTTDKRFIFLQDGTWDLKDNHKVSIVLDEDEIEEPLEEEEEDVEIETYDDDIENDDDDDRDDDDMEDLSIIDDEMVDGEEEV